MANGEEESEETRAGSRPGEVVAVVGGDGAGRRTAVGERCGERASDAGAAADVGVGAGAGAGAGGGGGGEPIASEPTGAVTYDAPDAPDAPDAVETDVAVVENDASDAAECTDAVEMLPRVAILGPMPAPMLPAVSARAAGTGAATCTGTSTSSAASTVGGAGGGRCECGCECAGLCCRAGFGGRGGRSADGALM